MPALEDIARRGKGRAKPSLERLAQSTSVKTEPAPQEAEAQLFPEATPENAPIGDLVTRVKLGYWLPQLKGDVQLNPKPVGFGSNLSFDRRLDLVPEFIVPTFEAP